MVEWYTYHDGSTTDLIAKSIKYKAPQSGYTSGQPVEWSYFAAGDFDATYTYSYDANGNIVSETLDGKTTTYVYDSANQLIRENNQRAGKTLVWTYDDAGNILSETEYVYTTGTPGTPQAVRSYSYGDSNWGDLLTSYNGNSISYDAIGNPLNDGTWTYTWQEGRKLAMMSKSDATWTFTYDGNGMRTSRTSGSVTYNYTYNGSLLTHMSYVTSYGTKELHFYYDATGRPLSFTFEGETYYYVLNLQGDVVAILDSSAEMVVGYIYDAWGRLIKTTDDSDPVLVSYNPLRYRGYVYDRETELYYLQSRYYNLEIGRFINADNQIAGVGGEVLGYNLLAYGMNNPVNMKDLTGNWPRWITATVAAVAIAVGVVALATGNLVVAAAAGKVAIIATATYAIQSVHYDCRKQLNDISTLPDNYDAAMQIEGADDGISAACHQFTAVGGANKKVCWLDGREAIYNSSGSLVTDSRDIGTYNFFVPNDGWGKALHGVFDVVPRIVFGNDDDDTTLMYQRVISLFKGE